MFLIQAWIMWNFITFHLHRARERANAEAPVINKKLNSPSSPQRKKKRGPSVFTSLLTSILKTNFCHQKQAQLLYFVIIYFRLTDIFPGEAGSAGSPSSPLLPEENRCGSAELGFCIMDVLPLAVTEPLVSEC